MTAKKVTDNLRKQGKLGCRSALLVVPKRGAKGRAPIDAIGVRNVAHLDGLMSPGAKVEDCKSATRIKED